MKYNKKVNDFFKLVIRDISTVEYDYKVMYPQYKGVPLPLPQYEISMGTFRPSIVTAIKILNETRELREEYKRSEDLKALHSVIFD